MASTVEFIYLAARLARQWMKERGIIVCALSVWFIYLATRLARQWIKERGIIVCALSVWFIYLAARLARQWIKERGIIVCSLSVKFVHLAARWARREIVVTKTCRIIKTNGCYDQFLFIQTVLAVSHIRRSLACERRPISGCYWCRQRRQTTAKNSSQASDQSIFDTVNTLDLMRSSTEFASEISAPRISTSFEFHLDFLVNLGDVGVYHVSMCMGEHAPFTRVSIIGQTRQWVNNTNNAPSLNNKRGAD